MMEETSQNLSRDNTSNDTTVTTPPSGGSAPAPDIESGLKAIGAALDQLDAALRPWRETMTPAELRSIIFVNKEREPYLEAGNIHNESDGSEYLPGKKRDSLHDAYLFWKGLEPLAQRNDQLRQQLRTIQAVAGSKCYLMTSDLEQMTAREGARGDMKARQIAVDLASKRPYTGPKKPEPMPNSDAGTQTTPKEAATADVAV